MRRMTRLLTIVALPVMILGCERAEETQTTQEALEAITTAVMVMPVTTTSDVARNHFMQGQQTLDVGRIFEARAHFQQAVEADPTFAHGYLRVATTATSLDKYTANLKLAEEHAATASEAEQLLVQIERAGFENNTEVQLELARRLVDMQASSPRARLTLASIQTSLNQIEDARASIQTALELAPRFLPAHTQLGNSYLYNEPKDFVKAEEHFRHATEMAPNEQLMHDFLGDALRAQGNMAGARDAYTRASQLDPDNALPLQQRGHVNSFLGDYDAARADYDAAIALGKANEPASFAIWRALVNVHAGNPQAGIDELTQLVTKIDQMNIPEPRGVKVNALTNAAIIAGQTGMYDQAEPILRRRAELMMARASEVGTDEFLRGQEANITYFDAWLAAKRGNYARARQLTDQYAKLMEPTKNPRKMEGVHELQGLIEAYQGNHQAALTHLRQGNTNNLYIKYRMAQAEEAVGNTQEAQRLYREVATFNFNNVNSALLRKDAMQKAG